MKHSVKVRYNKKEDLHYFALKDFKQIIDTSVIQSYKIEFLNDNSIRLSFYDSSENQVYPKEFTIDSTKRQRVRSKKKSEGTGGKKQVIRNRITKGKKTL